MSPLSFALECDLPEKVTPSLHNHSFVDSSGGLLCPPVVGGRDPPPYIKTPNFPSLQSVTKGSYIFLCLKKIFRYIKSVGGFKQMQKNSAENFTTVEVDPVTGEYYVTIPEWIISEFGWYEGTEVNMEVDGDSIVISEIKPD